LPRHRRSHQRGNQSPTGCAKRLPRERFSPPLHWSRSGSRDRWLAYGLQVQQAWREQLMPGTPPEFDPDEPF
jgi:hypothetical protein